MLSEKNGSFQQNDFKLLPLLKPKPAKKEPKEPHSESFSTTIVGFPNEEEINHRLIECNLAENAFPGFPFFATQLCRAASLYRTMLTQLRRTHGYGSL